MTPGLSAFALRWSTSEPGVGRSGSSEQRTTRERTAHEVADRELEVAGLHRAVHLRDQRADPLRDPGKSVEIEPVESRPRSPRASADLPLRDVRERPPERKQRLGRGALLVRVVGSPT